MVLGIAIVSMGMIANAQAAPTSTNSVRAASTTAQTAPMDAKTAKKMKLQGAVAKMEQSLEVRIGNLDGLAARIQTRIAKLQAEGKDMTMASAKLAEAQVAIAAAKTELATLKKADAAMVAAAKPATAFAGIKNKTTKNVVAKIKIAHKALVDTVVIMKGQGGAASATSTAQ